MSAGESDGAALTSARSAQRSACTPSDVTERSALCELHADREPVSLSCAIRYHGQGGTGRARRRSHLAVRSTLAESSRVERLLRLITNSFYNTNSSPNFSNSTTLNLPLPSPSPNSAAALQLPLVPSAKLTISTSHPRANARLTHPRKPVGLYSEELASPVTRTRMGRGAGGEGGVEDGEREGEESSRDSRILR